MHGLKYVHANRMMLNPMTFRGCYVSAHVLTADGRNAQPDKRFFSVCGFTKPIHMCYVQQRFTAIHDIKRNTFYVESRELCMHGLSLPGNCKYQNIWFLVNCTKYIIIATYYAKCMGHMLYMAKETTIDQKTFSVCYDQYRP